MKDIGETLTGNDFLKLNLFYKDNDLVIFFYQHEDYLIVICRWSHLFHYYLV